MCSLQSSGLELSTFFIHCTQLLDLTHTVSQGGLSEGNKNSNSSTLSMNEELKLKYFLIILYIYPVIFK